jgi:hypothetical protein
VTHLQITPDLDRAPWEGLPPIAETLHGAVTRVGLLPNGTLEGKASVALAIHLDDGRAVVAEITWRAFYLAIHALAVSPIGSQEVDG